MNRQSEYRKAAKLCKGESLVRMMERIMWERKLILVLLLIFLILELIFSYSGFKLRKENKLLGWVYFIFGVLLSVFILYLIFSRLFVIRLFSN